MTREEIVHQLKSLQGEVEKKFRARIKGIFGSVARGTSGEGSDVDILVEFQEGSNLLHHSGLSLFLEEKLKMAVDVVPEDALRQEIRDDVLKEAIFL